LEHGNGKKHGKTDQRRSHRDGRATSREAVVPRPSEGEHACDYRPPGGPMSSRSARKLPNASTAQFGSTHFPSRLAPSDPVPRHFPPQPSPPRSPSWRPTSTSSVLQPSPLRPPQPSPAPAAAPDRRRPVPARYHGPLRGSGGGPALR
jgi:hypothetical protein